MPLQILSLKLDGITAGDYLTWCRDPEPTALDYALRSISIDADPLGDTITATLDWNQPLPTPPAAAAAAGLPHAAGVKIDPFLTDRPHSGPAGAEANPHLTCAPPPVVRGASREAEQRRADRAGAKGRLRTWVIAH